jgi:hypothetical protein
MIKDLAILAVGFAGGFAFRNFISTIKALLVKGKTKVETDVKTEVNQVVTDIKSKV